MQRMASFLYILLLVILVACSKPESKITQVEAETIVLQLLTEDFNKDKNEFKIKSVSNSKGKYIVEWEIDECNYGAVQVNDQSGEILELMETIC